MKLFWRLEKKERRKQKEKKKYVIRHKEDPKNR